MIAAVPVAAPAVVRTIEVLAAVAADVEVAVKEVTVLAMEIEKSEIINVSSQMNIIFHSILKPKKCIFTNTRGVLHP